MSRKEDVEKCIKILKDTSLNSSEQEEKIFEFVRINEYIYNRNEFHKFIKQIEKSTGRDLMFLKLAYNLKD